MLCVSSRLLPLLALGLVPACSTYSSLDGALLNGKPDQADGGSGGSAGDEGGGAMSSGAAKGGDGGSNQESGGTAAVSGGAGSSGAAGGGSSGAAGGSAGSTGSGGGAGDATVKPSGLSLAAEATDLVRELNSDGTLYSERCPENQVLIGFHGTVDAPGGKTYLRSAQAICGELSVSADIPYEVIVTEANTLAMHDIAAAEMETARCPENQVMIGFGGRSGLWMDSVDVRCAPLTILGMSPTFLLVTGTASTAGTIGGTDGSPFDPLECAPGDVAVGQIIRTIYSGVVIGAFGVQCATLTLGVEPG